MWLAPVSCEWFGAGDLCGDVTLASRRACVGCGGDVLLVVGLARWCSWGIALSSGPVMWRPSGSRTGEVVGRRSHGPQYF
jgi:hypothetical protein